MTLKLVIFIKSLFNRESPLTKGSDIRLCLILLLKNKNWVFDKILKAFLESLKIICSIFLEKHLISDSFKNIFTKSISSTIKCTLKG